MTDTGSGRLSVGLDVGGTKVLAVAIDPEGAVVAGRKVDSPPAGPSFAAALASLAADVAGGVPGAVGVGVPGMVDTDGNLRFSPHQPGLVGVPLARDLSGALGGVHAWVGNDATCAGWAEHARGAAKGADDVLMVTLGTGIGGGIVAGGRLLEGAHRYAGEIGHMVVEPSGPVCACGQRGCWEQLASGRALGRLGRRRAEEGRAPAIVSQAGGDPGGVRGEHVTAAAATGDADAVEVMVEYAGWLALGLANVTNVLDPAVVVIGGGLVEAGEVLMGPLRAAFARLVEGHEYRAGLSLLPAALGERAGAVGAALLAGGGLAGGALAGGALPGAGGALAGGGSTSPHDHLPYRHPGGEHEGRLP